MVGVRGIVSIILWQRASRNRDSAKRTAPRCWMRLSRRNDATAEDAKKSACAASRCQARRETESRVPTSFDPDKDTGELSAMPGSGGVHRRTPHHAGNAGLHAATERAPRCGADLSESRATAKRRTESCKARRTCAEARAAAPGKSPEAGCTDSAGKACPRRKRPKNMTLRTF